MVLNPIFENRALFGASLGDVLPSRSCSSRTYRGDNVQN
jgi:hypothetical protein